MTQIDKLAWLAIRDRRLLCVRSHGKTLFYIPGGKRDPGESDQGALLREISEELTVRLAPATLRLAGDFEAQADGKQAGVRVRLRCFFGEGEGTPTPAAEIAELAWLGSQDKERLSAPALLVVNWLHEQDLID
ncbi:NUDIX hydrolase [Aeromonas sobria]|uniref:NUDIX hydrolase n=1 Tax=Aeromonas sobria TaxID=646 RepID=UPI003D04E2CE